MKTIKKFLGLRNDVAEDAFNLGDLAVATNVDIDTDGGLASRGGTRSVHADACHSAWSNGSRAFYVRDTSLVELHADETETVWALGIPARKVSFAELNSAIYWMCGSRSGMIVGDKAYGLGIKRPNPPAVSSLGGAGSDRIVSCVLVRSDGIESPASMFVREYMSDLISVTLPSTLDVDVVKADLFVSLPNGEVPLFVGSFTPGDTVEVSLSVIGTAPIPNEGLASPPVGTKIFAFANRLWVVNGNAVFYSMPFKPWLFDLKSGYIPFDTIVRTCATSDNGLYIGTDKATYYVAGKDTDELKAIEVANYGTVSGTEVVVPGEYVGDKGVAGNVAMWLSKNGICYGDDGGNMRNITSSRYAILPVADGTGLFKLRGSVPQYLVTFN